MVSPKGLRSAKNTKLILKIEGVGSNPTHATIKMKYRILINYDTGDSFNQDLDNDEYLALEWTNLDIVKENCSRIKEHYKYCNPDRYSYKTNKQWKDYHDDAKSERWYRAEYPETSLIILKDDGSEFIQSSFYAGYFETLNYIKIVTTESDFEKQLIDYC